MCQSERMNWNGMVDPLFFILATALKFPHKHRNSPRILFIVILLKSTNELVCVLVWRAIPRMVC